MAESDWGQKHMCFECQAPFYDMRRKPITCPKCGAAHQPVAILKSAGKPPRRTRLQPTMPVAPVVEPQEEPVASADPEAPELDDAADQDVDDAAAMDDTAEPIGGDQAR